MFNGFEPKLVMNEPVVKELAKKYNKNVGQVCGTHNALILFDTAPCTIQRGMTQLACCMGQSKYYFEVKHIVTMRIKSKDI